MTAGDLLAVITGSLIVVTVLLSALRTVVLPQGGLTRITRFVFAVANRIFTSLSPRRVIPRRLAGLYAPAALVSLPFAWSMLIAVGFALVFWGLGVGTFYDAWVTSGSSLFTLGFEKPDEHGLIWITFVEATIGLGIVALLISYLPTLYTAYSAREQGVGTLAPLTGTPPSATQLLWRLQTARSLTGKNIWGPASAWFVAIEQTHTAFPALSGFPPQREDRSWVASAGTVLDAAALLVSVAELADDGPVIHTGTGEVTTELGGLVLVIAHGTSAVAGIAQAAGLDVEDPPTLLELLLDSDAEVGDISIRREEYEEAIAALTEAGAVGQVDLDRGWIRFARVRAAYDRPIRGLAGLTHAPEAPWTTDRALVVGRPRFFSRRPVDAHEP